MISRPSVIIEVKMCVAVLAQPHHHASMLTLITQVPAFPFILLCDSKLTCKYFFNPSETCSLLSNKKKESFLQQILYDF